LLKLGIGKITPAQAAAARASLSSDPEAARLYAEGLEKLRVWGAREIRPAQGQDWRKRFPSTGKRETRQALRRHSLRLPRRTCGWEI